MSKQLAAWATFAGALGCADGPSTASTSAGSVASFGVSDGSDSSHGGATLWEESDTQTSGSSTTETQGDSTSGELAQTSSSTGEATSDGGGGGPPPDIWTACTTDVDCSTSACIRRFGPGTSGVGFCSGPCFDPVLDCGPPAEGTAAPVCREIEVEESGEFVSLCLLDCGGGASCPQGLSCSVVQGLQSVCL